MFVITEIILIGHSQLHYHLEINTYSTNKKIQRIAIFITNYYKFNTLTNYTTLYHTYQLLYCKEHIQITSNHSNVNVKTKNTIE